MESSPVQTIDQVIKLEDQPGLQPALEGALTGSAFRFLLGAPHNGTVITAVGSNRISPRSHVFITACEADFNGTPFLGAASYTVQNVVPQEGRVLFRLVIDWPTPLLVSIDILIIDP